MYANRRNFRVLKKLEVEEHDVNIKFYTGSRNMTVSRMRNEKYAIQPLFTGRIAEISTFYRKSWSRNTMVNVRF